MTINNRPNKKILSTSKCLEVNNILGKKYSTNLKRQSRNNYSMKTKNQDDFVLYRIALEAMKRSRFGYRRSVALRNENHLRITIIKPSNNNTECNNESLNIYKPIHKKQKSLVIPVKPSLVIRNKQPIKDKSINLTAKQNRLLNLSSDHAFDTEVNIKSIRFNKRMAYNDLLKKKLMSKRLSFIKQTMLKCKEIASIKQLPEVSTKKSIICGNKHSLKDKSKTMNLSTGEKNEKLFERLREKLNVEKDMRVTLIPTLRVQMSILEFSVHDIQFQISDYN